MSLKYGIMEIDDVNFYAVAAMEGILSCYRAVDGKLDLPPPELLANTAFGYAEAMYAKKKEVANQEISE